MSDTNRLQVTYVEEVTQGTTPAISGTTVMRTARLTGESLNYNITNIVSNEIRTDRMVPDLIQASAQNSGGLNYEFSYPVQRSFIDQMIGGALYNTWTALPYKNNIVADTEVANVAAGTGIYTIDAGGATFLAGFIVKMSGFTAAANSGVFNVTANSANTITTDNTSSVLEAAPPVGATIQTVGFKFASGDLVATTTGLTCTTANFVNMGLKVGQWVKIGGTGAANQFATAANNDFVRITAVSANAITLDNRPSGWGADSGTGKTVKLWFGDTIKNGITQRFFTIEKGFMDVNQFFVYKGMVPTSMSLALNAQQIATGSFDFMGTTHTTSGSSLSGSPAAASAESIVSAMANVARIAENGAALGPANYVQSMTLQLQNNPRAQTAVGLLGLIGIGSGRCDVTGTMNCYFSDRTQYDKYVSGTPTNVNFRLVDALTGRATVFTAPNIEFETGSVVAGQGNADLFGNFTWRSKFDSLTNSHLTVDRFPYYE